MTYRHLCQFGTYVSVYWREQVRARNLTAMSGENDYYIKTVATWVTDSVSTFWHGLKLIDHLRSRQSRAHAHTFNDILDRSRPSHRQDTVTLHIFAVQPQCKQTCLGIHSSAYSYGLDNIFPTFLSSHIRLNWRSSNGSINNYDHLYRFLTGTFRKRSATQQ